MTRPVCAECGERPVMLGRSGDWSSYCSRLCKRRAKNRRRLRRRALEAQQ